MALPIDFITRTRALLGKEFASFENALGAEIPISIRMNCSKKGDRSPVEIQTNPVAWSQSGYYLPERLTFTFDPLFHAGAYYVQEASSMFLEQVIRTYVKEPIRCLDLCAAPGGKSTLLASCLPEKSLLVSNEVIRNRSNILAENMTKWGNPNCIVTNNDPEEIGQLTHLFDLIVADVPCSGEGMFRKDSDSIGEWSVANVELCASRSRRIIHDIWNALKPGGLLVYSTCTYNTEEDEENIHYIKNELGADVLSVPTELNWQISGPLKYTDPVYRFFPHKTRGEGFFLAVLRKTDNEAKEIRMKGKSKKDKSKSKATPDIPTTILSALLDTKSFTPEWEDNQLWMHSESVHAIYPRLRNSLRILSAGIHMGEAKGKDFIPHQSLAHSSVLNPEAFPTADLNWEEAIRYLRKEAITLPPDNEKGYLLVRYQGYPLGFVKNLGNRSNNLYPQEWRIRTSYLPEEIKNLTEKV